MVHTGAETHFVSYSMNNGGCVYARYTVWGKMLVSQLHLVPLVLLTYTGTDLPYLHNVWANCRVPLTFRHRASSI